MRKPYHLELQAQIEQGENFITVLGRVNYQVRKEFVDWLQTLSALAQEAELLEKHNEQSRKTENETQSEEKSSATQQSGASNEPPKTTEQDGVVPERTSTSVEDLHKLLNRSKKNDKG